VKLILVTNDTAQEVEDMFPDSSAVVAEDVEQFDLKKPAGAGAIVEDVRREVAFAREKWTPPPGSRGSED